IVLLCTIALLAVSRFASAGVSGGLDRASARQPCDDIYEHPPAKIAQPVRHILTDQAAEAAGVDIPDSREGKYLDAHFRAEAKIRRWLTEHCLVCTNS